MKNLGKIFLLVLFLFSYNLYALVEASVDSNHISQGDVVTYSLKISATDITKPDIVSLCGSDIISTGSQKSIEMINGDVKRSYILTYRFAPQKSCEIAPIKVKVDGKTEQSNPVKIEVSKYVSSPSDDFILTLKSEKKEVYVGEPFKVTLTFKQKDDAQALDSKFEAPKLKGFWIKKESKAKRYKEDGYMVTKLIYTMAAQRVGDLEISEAKIKIATRSNTRDVWGVWMPQLKYKTYFSNSLDIVAKPLPEGVGLIGDFSIKAIAQKHPVGSNEAFNVVVEVDGVGNLEDIKSFKPTIEGVGVFDEKAVIQGDKLTQKLAFVSDKDFTIPPFELKFFDTKTAKIKTIKTQSIDVKIKGSKQITPPLTIKYMSDEKKKQNSNKVVVYKNSKLILIGTFMAGLVCGVLLMLLKPWIFGKKEKSVNIDDKKTIIIKLLPYKDDKEVKEIIDILEADAYTDEKATVDKKLLKRVLKRYGI